MENKKIVSSEQKCLEVQKYLRKLSTSMPANKALEMLGETYSIQYAVYNGLVLLNYSRTNNPLANDCRQLVLEQNTWNVVGKSVYRFYDIEDEHCKEALAMTKNPNFDCTLYIHVKLDGTPVMAFYYNNNWVFVSRTTFLVPGSEWYEKAKSLIKSINLKDANKNFSYIFEFVTPFNRIISNDKYGIYLIAVCSNEYPHNEYLHDDLDKLALQLNCSRPAQFLSSSCGSMELPHILHLNLYHDEKVLAQLQGDCTRPKRVTRIGMETLLPYCAGDNRYDLNSSRYQDILDVREGFVASVADAEKDENTGLCKMHRVKVKMELYNIIHTAKNHPSPDIDTETDVIAKIDTVLFLGLAKYPELIENEMKQTHPFLLSHSLCERFFEIKKEVDEVKSKLCQFRSDKMLELRRISENKNKNESELIKPYKSKFHADIAKFSDNRYMRGVLLSPNRVLDGWDVEKDKKALLEEIVNRVNNKLGKPLVYRAFTVMGDKHNEYTRDIDVAIQVDDEYQFHQDLDEKALYAELKKLGYSDEKELDINLYFLNDKGQIAKCKKGGKEIQNIIYYTHHLHKQKYDCPIKAPLDVEQLALSSDKNAVGIATFVLRHSEILLSPETKVKEKKEEKKRPSKDERARAYISETQRRVSAIRILEKIAELKIDNPIMNWRDEMKSLTMKIIQLCLLTNRHEVCYEKQQLAKLYGEMYPECKFAENACIWLLSRGRFGEYTHGILQHLVGEYIAIHNDLSTTYNFKKLPLDGKCRSIDTKLYTEFKKNPENLGSYVLDTIEQKERELGCLNAVFVGECMNLKELPEELLERTVTYAPRSDNWRKAYSFYTCGSTTSVKPYHGENKIQYYSNLVRGAICEAMVIDECDFGVLLQEPVIKIQVGFFVEKKFTGKFTEEERGCKGCAPDLILKLKNGQLVVVEIKTLMGVPVSDNGKTNTNKDYRRAVDLARRQLYSAKNMIGKYCASFGIIAILYVFPSKETNEYMYELRASVVNL